MEARSKKARTNPRKGTHSPATLKRLAVLYHKIDVFQIVNRYPPSFLEMQDFRDDDGKPVIPPHTSVTSYYMGLMEQFGMIKRHKGKKGKASARAITLCPVAEWDVTMREYLMEK